MTNEPIDEQKTIGVESSAAATEGNPPSPESAENLDPLGFSKSNPMLIKRMEKNAEGGLDYTFSLTAQQTYVLLNFAIMFLVTQGLAQFVEQAGQAEGSLDEVIVLGDQLH